MWKKKMTDQKMFTYFDQVLAAMTDESKNMSAHIAPIVAEPDPKRSRPTPATVLMDPSGKVIDQAALLREKGIFVGVYMKKIPMEGSDTKESVYRVVHELEP